MLYHQHMHAHVHLAPCRPNPSPSPWLPPSIASLQTPSCVIWVIRINERDVAPSLALSLSTSLDWWTGQFVRMEQQRVSTVCRCWHTAQMRSCAEVEMEGATTHRVVASQAATNVDACPRPLRGCNCVLLCYC